MKIFYSALLCLGFVWANAQVMEDQTNVLDSIQGEPLFTLNPGEYVHSFEPVSGWYKIRKEVYADPAAVVDKEIITSGTTLENEDGDDIGMTIVDVKVVEGVIVKAFRASDRFHAIIEGYVFKTKFMDDSRPEERITELLATKSRGEQTDGFNELFKRYGFEKRQFEELTAYAYREENKTLKEDKDFRIIVIFRGQSPFAVVTNDQSVKVDKIKASWEDSSYKAIYMYKPTPAQETLIQDEILYTFLGL